MNSAINIDDLSVLIEKKEILSEITVSMPTGKIIGLLGPSGAGKTTLIRTILGLQKAHEGTVNVLDIPAGSKKVKSEIGYVTQSPSVYPDLTVQENMHYFANILSVSRSSVEAVLKKVELNEYKKQLVKTLSGGQTTRVSLAVALLGDPKILLLDEPTVGLDPVLRKKLWRMFDELAKNGKTVLISSHVMDEAENCDSIIFMRHGKVLTAGSKQTILSETQTSTMEEAFISLATKAEK